MPTLQPTPPFLELAISVLCGDQVSFNRFFYDASGAGDAITHANLVSATTAWGDGYLDVWKAFAAADCHLFRYTGRYRSDLDLFESFQPKDEVGVVDSEALPFQDCGVITWEYPKPGAAAKITRGRSFISGLPESRCEGGLMDITCHDRLLAIKSQVLTAATIGGHACPLIIWSPSLNVKQYVTEGRADVVIKTLRRRRQRS